MSSIFGRVISSASALACRNNPNELDDELFEEEPGEEIESAPPLKIGQERVINKKTQLKKKLLKLGLGWESPEFGDEVTLHYVGTLLDVTKFDSSRDEGGEPLSFKLGHDKYLDGLNDGIITMKKGEVSLFTLPFDSCNGNTINGKEIPPNCDIQYEVELVSWITVVDICKDGGIIKRILEKSERNEQPGDLDDVLVKYRVMLDDGSVVAETPEEGVEFQINDGHFCPAFPKAIKTMKRGERVNLLVQAQYAFGEKGRDANHGFPAIPSNSTLTVDLKLISIKHVIDLTGDSKVVKKILKEGEGSHTADEGTPVTVRYTAKLEDNTVFEKKGLDGDLPLEFVTDEDQVIAGLDLAAATMKKGELSIVTVKPDYGFGSTEVKKDLAIVHPCSTVIYEVEMVDFTKAKAPREMNNREKIETAEKKKEEGNTLFKSGKYQKASRRYDKAVDYITVDGTFWDDEQQHVDSLRVLCWLNHAACCLKLNNYPEAIELCSKVLDVEYHNVKALYRRAQAYMKTADFDLSELDINKALEVDPDNREVKILHKTLKQLRSESNKGDAKLYTNMLTRMREDSTVVSKRQKVEKAEVEEMSEVAQKEIEQAAGSLGGADVEQTMDVSAPPQCIS
ncbi:70 kDa peptidyl-prolyl isomerase-like isoform X1 [Papaver somniferum]|uniref:70 kDa peptidyl-prolyl isomerase-like isoform X1 n=2 Tax=Papaver somniferum TaxID=3469 RepID=UPI000E6FE67D|nr:70 kDa peptidyl-prolyl isomerase-like isoform X1 [Papaver somniferum]